MTDKNNKYNLRGQTRFIVLIFIIIAALMISSAIIELQQSKAELYQLMNEQAHSLLESVIIASQNALQSADIMDNVLKQRLLNNANLIKNIYESGTLNNNTLEQISRQNDIYRINIFNKNRKKILSSYRQEHFDLPEKNSPQQILEPVFSGQQDSLIIGYKEARYEPGYRFAIAKAAKDGAVIVLNIDAEKILQFKRDIGFGALLRRVVSENKQIVFVALQDSANILAASGNVNRLESLTDSEFLQKSFRDSIFYTRTSEFDTIDVFEAVHPFSHNGETVGLFRLGLSLEPIHDINDRIYRRIIIITIILISIGFVLFVYIFTRQRLNILQKQYDVVETYSGNIIRNVSDAIIVLNRINGIIIFNNAAEKLFSRLKKDVTGKHLSAIFSGNECTKIIEAESVLNQINCTIENQEKSLLISKNSFNDTEENKNTILVIRDLTEQKQMEAQLERQQRLTAMGELASGVAHEIRNPLNTIGTIMQQLDKDFEPSSDKEEYHELAGLVHNEVKRINDTVQDFLRFARPEPVQAAEFSLTELLDELKTQYKPTLKSKGINLNLQIKWTASVYWDKRQMKQVFINLIQNAIEAIESNGEIQVKTAPKNNDDLEIVIQDNGPGMTEKVRNNIFNLYFTTKAKGTGIGLSIVQRIIYEHGGIITVFSEPEKGTTFIIRLPAKITNS